MAVTLSREEEISRRLQELDAAELNQPTRQEAEVPSSEQNTNRFSPDLITQRLRELDEQEAKDTGPGWVSDKVRRVGQGAAEGLIGATEGFFNISSKEVNKPFPFANYYGGPGNPAALLNLLAKPRQDSGLADKLSEWAATAREFKKEQKDVYGANPAMDKDIASAVASGVGSSAAGIATALATRGASLPTYAVTALQLYQENFDSALEAGQDTDTAHKSGMMAMPLAAFEKIGDVRIGKLLRESVETAYTGGKEALKELLKKEGKKLVGTAAGEGAAEGAQEAGKQVIENEILGYKDQSPGERVALTGMSALIGSLAGTVMGSPGAAINVIGNALKTDQPQTKTKAIDESTDQVRQQQPQGTAIPEVQTQPVPTVQQEPQQVPVQVAPVVAENATTEPALTPPIEAQQISEKNGRPLVPMTGPDNQTHWFTFDGYQPLARGRTEPSFTLVSQDPAPGLTQGGTFYPRSLAGYKPLSPVPTIEEWNGGRLAAEIGPTDDRPFFPAISSMVKKSPVMDFDSIKTVNEDGYLIVDMEKLTNEIVKGKIKGSEAGEALLSHFIKDYQNGNSNHPLDSIRLVDESPSETGFQGRFSEGHTGNALIEVVTRTQNGPLTQSEFIMVMNHELVHNAITSKLKSADQELISKALDLFEFSRSKAIGTKFEGTNAFKNVSEFFSDGLSIASFRNFLAGLDYSDGGNIDRKVSPSRGSALGSLLSIVKRILQLPNFITVLWSGKQVEAISALDQMVSISEQLESKRRTKVSDENAASFSGNQSPRPPSPEVSAQGLPEIRKIINESTLPDNTKAVFIDMLSQPVMQRPEFAELTVALRNKLAVGGRPAEGIARVSKKLIEISTSKADEKALPHELFHFFYEMLSPNDQALISRWRLQEIQERYGDDAPAILVSGNMKSRQAYSEGIPMSDYHLINDTEFLAGKFGRQFAEESTARNNPDRDTLLNKIKVWIQELWNAIKRRFQNEPEKLAAMQQMYEGILSGRILNTPQSGIKFEESASFVKTPDEAINEGKKQQTAEQQLIEGRHQVAQSADIVKSLEKFGVVAMDPEVQAKLRYSDFVGIQASGDNLLGTRGDDYRSIKRGLSGVTQTVTPTGTTTVTNSRLANPYQLTWTARIAGSQMRGFDMTLTDVIAQRDAKEKEVTNPAFVNTMLKEMDAKNRTDLADQNTDLMNSVLDTAIAKAEKALRTEAKNERQIDEIKGQIREMNEARNSSVAMHQLVDDMVAVLSSTEEGFQLLTDPAFGTRTDIAKLYETLKKQRNARTLGRGTVYSGDPLRVETEDTPLHHPNLIKWATFVLQRNKRLLNNLMAGSMVRQSGIRAEMTNFENDLTNQLKKSPAKTIKAIRKGTAKMVTEKERAKFAWKVLNKKVMEKLDEYNVLSEAAEVAEQIKADPDFRKLNKEIQTDSGGLGYQQPFEPFIHDTILLPSGRELNVKADHSFANETTEFLKRHKDIEAGIKELQTWLGDPANLDDINYNIHERNLKTLDNYYTGMGLMLPSDKNNMFNSVFGLTMGILNNVVDDIGGRPSYPLQKAVSKYSSAHETMVKWLQKWSVQLTDSRIKAMQSHKQKWGSFSFKNDLEEANRWYHANVGNPLKYSHNTQQGGAKIGDTLPTGQVVTKEDMDAMRMESEAAEDLFKKGQKEFGEIDQPYAMDDLGGFILFRNSLKPGENGTPRTYSQVAAAVFSEANMLKALEDTQSTDPAISGPAINTVLSLLDEPEIWQKYGPGFVSDRFFKPAQATVFDGPGGALTILKNDALKFPNASALMHEVESLTGYTFEEVKNILIPEWSRPIPTFVREVQIENSSIKNKPVEQKTAFTKSRNEAIVPYTFYEYGFRVGSSLTKFASGIQARSVDRVIQGLTQSKTMLQNLERELESKIERDALISGPGAARRVMKSQAELNKNGDNYDRYQNLQRRIRDIDRQLTILNGADFLSADDALGRVIYAVTGPLLGAPSTARNILDGPRYVGWQMDRLLGSHLQAHALSLWYGWVGSNLKNLTKGVYGVGKATLKTLAYGPTVNLVKTLVNPNERNFRGYAKNVMGTWMEEISNMYNQRIKDFADGIIEGTMHELPPGEKEANARLMGSILSQGTLLDESFTRKQKFMLAPLAIWETLFVNPNRKLNPAFGDSMLNAGLIKALRSSWGPLSFYEQQAGKLADMHSKGFRPFDFANPDNPINELASKEIFGPSWVRWITSPEDLRNAVFLFKRGGLDFQRLMLKLVDKRVNGNTSATLLTGRELTDLSNSTIAQANRGGVANNPAFAFSKDPMARFAIPFLNWPFRTLSDLNNMASWSTQVKGQKGKSTEALRLKQAMANSAFIMLPLLSIFGVVVSYGSTWAYRELKKLIYNQELPYPLPHERDGLSGLAKGLGIEMLNNIPLIGGALSMGLNDSTPRASMNPDFVMVQKAKDVIKYFGGVVQTGDITYKLPEFLMGMVPDSRIIVSRLPGFEGKSELNNAANLLRRYGPTDDLKPMGARAGVVATELTPYGDRMANAAIAGDMTSFKQIYDEAVEVATKLGKANPDRVVKEMFRSRNPYDRVFKSKITDAAREQILAKATPEERALIESVEAKFKTAAESIGASSNFTSEQSEAAKASRSSSTGTGTGPRASGSALGAIGMAGVAGSRSTRARTGRGRTRFSSGRTRRSRVSLRTPRGRTRRIRSTVPSVRARKRRVSLRGLA